MNSEIADEEDPSSLTTISQASGVAVELYHDTATQQKVIVKTFHKRTLTQRKFWAKDKSGKTQIHTLFDRYCFYINSFKLFQELHRQNVPVVDHIALYKSNISADEVSFEIIYIVLGYCSAGSSVYFNDKVTQHGNESSPFVTIKLHKELEYRDRINSYPWRTCLRFLTSVTNALIALHSRGICHGDIKPQNVFIQDDNAILGDLDLCEDEETISQYGGSCNGTVWFRAPECFKGHNITGIYHKQQVDMWSLGMTLYIWLSGDLPPYYHPNPIIFGTAIVKVNPEDVLSMVQMLDCSTLEKRESVETILKSLLSVDPRHRWTCYQLRVRGRLAGTKKTPP